MPTLHVPILNAVGSFTEYLLRGIGQVMLQDNPVTGLLFLLGIFISSWVSGLYALLGTAVTTGTAILLGAPHDDVRRGLYGLNGTLTGLGLACYLRHDGILPIYVIVASMFVAIVMAAIQDIFGANGHALTGPFVVTTWTFIAALFVYSRLRGASVLGAPHLPGTVAGPPAPFSPADAVAGFLNGPAQVMLQQNTWTGGIFLIAIGVNSRISCAAAALGSAIGLGVAWFLGGSPIAIRDGLYGFNAVLTAIALGGLFFLLHRITVMIAVLAVCVSTVLYGAVTAVLGPLGLPALTAPFVVTTWACLIASAPLARLQALLVAQATTPEGNLVSARHAVSERR